MKRVLVVIGASSDMGVELIRECGKDYNIIIAHYRKTNDALEKVLNNLGNDKVKKLQCDFTDPGNCERADKWFREQADQLKEYEIHLAHFPANQYNNNRYHKISWATFQKEIDISVKSFVMISQILLPGMIKLKKGRIVLLLSYLVENIPARYVSSYVAVKYMLLGLLRSLAVEYAEKGITINGVSPSAVDTKFIGNQPDILIEQWKEKSPLKRNLNVSEVVPTIKFLFSEGASCINGENVIISCGMSAQ